MGFSKQPRKILRRQGAEILAVLFNHIIVESCLADQYYHSRLEGQRRCQQMLQLTIVPHNENLWAYSRQLFTQCYQFPQTREASSWGWAQQMQFMQPNCLYKIIKKRTNLCLWFNRKCLTEYCELIWKALWDQCPRSQLDHLL